MKIVLSLMLVIIFSWNPAFCCIGPKTEFQIGFSEIPGEPDNLIVKVKSKVTPMDNSKPTEDSFEYLDDDGFLSAKLAYVRLVKSKADMSASEANDLLSFVSDRLQAMNRFLDNKKASLVVGENVEEINEAQKKFDEIKSGIAEIKSMANSGNLNLDDLGRSFSKLKVWERISRYPKRKSSGDAWGESLIFHDLALPSEYIFKSASCNSEIGNLKTKIQRSQSKKAKPLPEFGVH